MVRGVVAALRPGISEVNLKMSRLVLAIVFVVSMLTACDRKDLIIWSPDGKRMAVLASDGLVLGDETGRISAPLHTDVEILRWLPDSKHAFVVSTDVVESWKDLRTILSASEQQAVVRFGRKMWRLGRIPQTPDA